MDASLLSASLAVSSFVFAREEWKREVGVMGGVLVGCILTPIGFLFLAVIPLLGFKPQGLDVGVWLTILRGGQSGREPWLAHSMLLRYSLVDVVELP
jgi:hypothetical protein